MITSILVAYAQTDTVCVSNPIGTYHVVGWPSSTYTWDAGSAGVITGQGNDSITVAWTSGAGQYTLSVFETSVDGCVGPTQVLNVVVLDLRSTESLVLCSNQLPFVWNGMDLNFSGVYEVTLQGAAGCDSIATLNLAINDVLTSTEDVTICSNQTPYTWNGADYSAAGTYTANLTSIAGCDSIATLNLIINDVLTSTEDITICSNQTPYTWNGADYSAAGTYTTNLTSIAGCDSIATLNLIINDVLTSTEDVAICSNQTPYTWNGADYSAAGTYTTNLTSIAGCDSIATLNLTINDVLTSTEDVTICSNQTPYIWNGADYSAAGTYTANLTSIAGCDSISTLNLIINDVLTSTEDVTICSNQSPYTWNGGDYSAAGTYIANLTSIAGCDSIATLNLAINDVLTSTEDVTICSNQTPYTWNGADYSAAGTYTTNLTSIAGCDSIATLNLIINDVLTSTEDVTICSNQTPYTWNGADYSNAGTYTANLISITGCDSIATLNLIINEVLTSTEDVTICSNQTPYTWNGVDYSAAGTYTANLVSITGCDSIAALNLTINDVLTSTEDITICSNQTPYTWNGVDYSTAGTYTANLVSITGCDSIAALNLTINDVLTSTEDITICSNQTPYTWNGVDYSAAGTYTANLTSIAGCDSIATLNLIINDVLTSTEDVTICSNQTPYTWNGADYNAAGTYTANLTSIAGCDSIATLNLAINDVLTSTEDITICSNQTPYTWNGADYSNAGTYTANLVSITGCDSIANLNLTINDILTSTEDITICSNQTPYTWNGVDYSTAGTYTANLTSITGCDSIANLNLTINDILTSTEDITICSNQTPYSWNGVDYSTAGTYTASLVSITGCDSIANLNLTINDILTSTVDITICSNQTPYTWNGVDYSNAGTYTANLTSIAGCDSIATLNLTINDVLTSTEDITICSNQTPYTWNGVDYSNAGTYTANLTSIAGCDSIATLNLIINDVLTSTEDITICSNQTPYTWNGVDYSNAGTYTASLVSITGCDSIANLNLTINDILTSTEDITICSNQTPYTWNGVDYSTAGTYTANLTSITGCDSIANLNLTINDILTSTEDITICSNQTPYSWNGADYSAAGTYTANLTSIAGCDSIATLNLIINDVLTSTEDITICSNQTPYTWNGVDYSNAGTYTANLTSITGCDSIATLNLTINDVLTSTEDITICSNQTPYTWNGVDYSNAGTYTANLTSITGCDSIATLNLIINDVLTSTEDITICSNQTPYTWNGVDYSNAGTYTANLTSITGCDSIATLNLMINDVLTSTEDVTICSNQSPYTWNGVDYSNAGTYTASLVSITGCDSIATLNLTINDVLTSTEDVTICSNQTPYTWNGVDYSNAGTYTASLTSIAGCDSIANLNLTINDVLTSTEDVTICSNQSPYTWNGVDYSTAGTYTANLTSITGCDSIATLNLIINDVLTSTEDITICSNQTPYTWNGVDYSNAGTYTANLTSIAGCDSIATLNLFINDVLTSVEDITICSNQTPYSWNGVDYSNAGTYTANLTSITGCDSIATLNLTINDVLTSTEDVTICSNQTPYSWNGVDYSNAGTYTANLTSITGCDSIATLNLTINDVLTSTEDITICSNQTPYTWNGVDYSNAGTYTASLTSIVGCDSITTLNLTINDILTSTEDVTICSNQTPYTWNGVDYSAAGTYTANLTSITGCDSIATLNLFINDVLTSTEDITICSNQTPYTWNGVDYSNAGTYTANLTSITGCDSIATLNLFINDVLTSTEDVTICSNQTPYTWNGVDYSNAGTYTANLTSITGCDSIATLNLIINDVLSSTEDITICSNQSPYTWNGVDYSNAGTYTANLTSITGCDSIATLNLMINDVLTSTEDVTICSNQTPYTWNGVDYSTAGTYTANLTSITGCDSIATLNLIINDVLSSTEDITICLNQTPYTWNGVDYSNAGTYTANLTSIAGCDSIATLNLFINDVLTSVEDITICSNQTPYTWNGVDYSAAGTYTANLTSIAGCDSIATLNLIINDVLTSTEDITICSNQTPYSWNGVDYSNAGTYTASLVSITGCDSIATLNLVINQAYSSNVQATINEGEIYTLPDGSNVSTSGVYTSNLLTALGCDSVITTTLIVLGNIFITVNEEICDNETITLPDGSIVNSPGQYVTNLVASSGADSIITTIVTVYPTYAYSINTEICEGEIYTLPNGLAVSATGTYPVTLSSINGCDSTITTHLIVNPLPASIIINNTGTTELTCDVTSVSLSASGGWNYLWNNGLGNSADVSISAPGVYEVEITSPNGCSVFESIEITQDIELPAPVISTTPNTTELNCLVESIILNASGGGTYLWNGSTTGASLTVDAPGSYEVLVELDNGCFAATSINIIQDITTPSLSITNLTGTNTLTCDITNIQLLGSGALSYEWSSAMGTSANITVNAPGVYTLTGIAANGCSAETSVTIGQNIVPPSAGIINVTDEVTLTCAIPSIELNATGGAAYQWSGGLGTSESISVDSPGLYTVTAIGTNGCTDEEEIIILQDINEPEPTVFNVTICEGESTILIDGSAVSTAGTYNITLEAYNGCDSIVSTIVEVLPVYNTFFAVRICPDETYVLPNGQGVTEPGEYPVTLQSSNGCDSTVTFIVDVITTYNIAQQVVICPGESYQLPDGTQQTGEGSYSFNYVSSLGCDSTVVYFLDIYTPPLITIPVTLCNGDSYLLPTGQLVNTSGNYPQLLQSYLGCDSTVVTQITVLPALQSTAAVELCQGDVYVLPDGASVWQAGIYSSLLQSVNGCDSTIVTNVSVQQGISVALVPFADTVNVCLGDIVTMNAVGANQFTWTPVDYLSWITNSTAEAAPPVSMWYHVEGTTGPCAAEDSVYVNIIPLPEVSAIAEDITICEGDSVLISASGASYYTWSPPLNNSCTNCESAVTLPQSTTTYTLSGYLNGCTSTTEVTVEVMQAALASVSGDTVVCENSPLILSASGGGNYLWNTGETTQTIEIYPSQDTTYSVIVTLGECTDSAFFDVWVAPFEHVYAGEDTLITLGSSVVLQASGANEYSWTPYETLTCAYCDSPTATPVVTTEYCVEGTDLWGCHTDDCVRIEVTMECETFFAPNVFAPDDGGHVENDCYRIYGTECFDTFKLTIYNRWGEIVFQTENKEDCWDGTHHDTPLNSAVFVYHLEGILLTGDEFTRKGNITLMR